MAAHQLYPSLQSAAQVMALQQNPNLLPQPFVPQVTRRVRPRSSDSVPDARSAHARNAPLLGDSIGADIVQLMATQAQLLQRIAAQQEAQHQTTEQHRQEDQLHVEFQDPSTLLKDVDPECKAKFQEWLKTFKKQLQVHVNQQELLRTYEQIASGGELMRQLSEEAKRKWQWPQAYLTRARPLSEAGEDPSNIAEYDIAKAWASMRERHARECQTFIFAHQKMAAHLAQDDISANECNQSLQDSLASHAQKYPAFYNDPQRKFLSDTARRYVELTIRSEMPKAISRIEVE